MAIKELRSLNFGGDDTYVPVPGDWNQTDETAADFIKNKPFGDVETEIFPLSEVTLEDMDGMFGFSVPCNIALVSGDTVKISHDGIEYVRQVQEVYGMTLFGNLALFGMEDTGEPFLGMVQFGMLNYADITATSEATKWISISATSAQKLPSRYVDGALPVFLVLDDSGVYRLCKVVDDASTAYTYAEITGAMNSNKPFIIKEYRGTRVLSSLETMISAMPDGTPYAGCKYITSISSDGTISIGTAVSAEYRP